MIAETVADGASIVSGGKRVSGRNAGAYFEPTILANVAETSVGFREEFFGPVLSVYTYEEEEEAIAMANHPLYALAASLYTDDARKALSIPKRLEAGTVWVNAHGRQPGYAHPQGGFNHSGFGREMAAPASKASCATRPSGLSHG